MKLSEAWEKAAKELKQGKEMNYDYSNDTHCAVGALNHYINGHEAGCLKSAKFPKETIDAIMAFNRKFGHVTSLNDTDNWTFETFAETAKSIGL